MNKRLTVSLPEQTIRPLPRLAGRGQRSSLVNRAVLRYRELKRETGANLRKRLAKSYAMNAALDRELAGDWFTIDKEASIAPDDRVVVGAEGSDSPTRSG